MATKKKAVIPNRYLIAFQEGMVGPYKGEQPELSDSIWRPQNYNERLKSLDPKRIARWFKAQGWKVEQRSELSERWRLDTGVRSTYTDLLKTNDIGDFTTRMNEVVEAVAWVMGWRGWEAFEFLSKV